METQVFYRSPPPGPLSLDFRGEERVHKGTLAMDAAVDGWVPSPPSKFTVHTFFKKAALVIEFDVRV